MNKKLWSWILTFSMFFSAAAPMSVYGGTSSSEGPMISSADISRWEGVEPSAGDTEFYIEVLGDNLNTVSPLGAEVLIIADDNDNYDPADDTYSKVASQVEARYLGKNAEGKEYFVFQMRMDGDGVLQEDTAYFINIKDKDDQLVSAINPGAFYVYSPRVPYVEELNVSAVASSIDNLKVCFEAYGFETGQTKNDISVELWQYDDIAWGIPEGTGTLMGTMGKDTMRADEIAQGGYEVEGSFTVLSSLTAGKMLCIKITASQHNETAGSAVSSGIHILENSTPDLKSFRVANGFAEEMNHENTEQVGGNYFIGNDSDILAFEIQGSGISDLSKLSAQLKDGSAVIGSMNTNPLEIASVSYGVYTITGSVDITGAIPNEGAELIISYDDLSLESAGIRRTDTVGVNYWEGDYFTYEGYNDIRTGSAIELRLVDTLNMNKSNITAGFVEDWSSDIQIPLDVESQYDGNDIELTIRTAGAISGNQILKLLYAGDPIKSLYYESDTDNFFITNLFDNVNSIKFRYNSETSAMLKSVNNQNGDLILKGFGFKEEATYEVAFIKRTGTSLSASPTLCDVSYISDAELKIPKSLVENYPRGWYMVYLKEDGQQLNGFIDVVLYSIDEGSSVVVYPTAKINNAVSYTTSMEVTFNLTPGTYTQVRYGETEGAVASASWQDIVSEIPYTLSDGFGPKTIYFQFRNDEGNLYEIQCIIIYRSSSLDDMIAFGIINAKEMGIVSFLNKDTQYNLFIKGNKATQGTSQVGQVEFLNDTGAIIHEEILRFASEKEDISTYSKWVSITDDMEEATSMNFYLRDASNSNIVSEMETVSIEIGNIADIVNTSTTFKSKYYDQTYVIKGSDVKYEFYGTPGFIAKAKLHYVDTANLGKVQEYALVHDNYSYQKTEALPNDAATIAAIEYTLEDPSSPLNTASKIETKNLGVTATVEFVGLDNSSGDFNGKRLFVKNVVTYMGKEKLIGNNDTSFEFVALKPGDAYTYRVRDSRQDYVSGNIALSLGETEIINLAGAEIPAKVRFDVSNGPEELQIRYKEGNANYWTYVEENAEVEGFYVGQQITYGVSMSQNNLKEYKIPEDETITVSEKSTTVDIALSDLSLVTISGTLTDAAIPDRKIEGATVSIQQSIQNGSNTIYHNDTAVTDDAGEYEIQVYPNEEGTISILKPGYRYEYEYFNVASNIVMDKALNYSNQQKITFNVYTRPMVSMDEMVDADMFLGMDASQVHYVVMTRENDEYINYYRANGYIQMRDNHLNAGDKVKVSFYLRDGLIAEEEVKLIELDEYLNGHVDVIAVKGGEVRANVITGGGDTPPVSYMLLFDEEGKQSAVVSGTGNLSSELIYLERGVYTAVIFSGYNLEKVANVKLLDAFMTLDLKTNEQYRMIENVVVENGRYMDLGDIELTELVKDEDLGFTDSNVITRYTPNEETGEVLVVARFKPDIDVEDMTLERIIIRSSATVKGNQVFYDGQTYPYNSIIPLDKQNTDGLLYFTLIPPVSEQTTLTIQLDYKVDGEIRKEVFGVDDIDVPKVSLLLPNEVIMGEEAKNVLVRGIGISGSAIEIYDEDQLIGKTEVESGKYTYATYISLPSPDVAAGHSLYSKMITPDGTIHNSVSRICEIIDPATMAYTSHFVFDNENGRVLSNLSPGQSNEAITFSYAPFETSHVSFRINNLLKDELSYVALVNTFNGADYVYEATHMQDVHNGTEKYSEWELEERIENPDELSVYYALEYDVPLASISGSKPIDFAKAIEQQDIDPAGLPPVIRENLDNRVVDESEDNLDITIPVEGGGSVRVTGSFSENHHVSDEVLIGQGYRKFQTMQGYYWSKESMIEDGNSLTYQRSMYFSPELTALLKGTGTIAGQNNGSRFPTLLGFLSKNDNNESVIDFQAGDTQLLALSVNDGLSKADYAGYVHNVADFVNDHAPNPANLGKIGKGMQVVGGAVLAGQVIMGASSKDHNTLYAEAAKIESSSVRSRLNNDIREYNNSRQSAHKVNVLFSGVSYGSGFAGAVGKGLSYVVSTGGMVYGEKVGKELDIHWDACMRDIQNELMLQNFRKNKKKIPKPGKKDKQKRPRWKMDPSGYVFEAIDSHRVEGITASALIYDEAEDAFYFWSDAEDWEEINPDITDTDGKYGWDVPAGDWKVRFEGRGYQTSETKSMTVPPIHDQVNIGLLSIDAPEVSGVALDSTGLEIEFDRFMQGETLYDAESGITNITVTDSSNIVVPCKQVDFLIEADNEGYEAGDTYQTSIINSDKFVKRVRFVVDDARYPGGFKQYQDDGITPETYKVAINTNAQSYSGVNLNSVHERSGLAVGERHQVEAPVASMPGAVYSEPVSVDFSTSTSDATIYYTRDNTTPTPLSPVYNGSLNISETAIVKLVASKVGMDDSNITTIQYIIAPEIEGMVAVPRASLPSGTYRGVQSVTLSTSLEGADIYYSTDGSMPTLDSEKYTTPIPIDTSMTLKAMAAKSGYANSSVVSYTYIIRSSSSGHDDQPIQKEEETPVPIPVASQFTDLSNYGWANEAIYRLMEKGVVKGISNTAFGPQRNIKRGDYLLLMMRLLDLESGGQNNFADVPPGSYYYNEIAAAKALGLITGTNDNLFDPESPISRQDMFVIAYRIMKMQGMVQENVDISVLGSFGDADAVSDYAKEALAYLISKGLVTGYNNVLSPFGTATRAETAVFVYRISLMMRGQS